MTIHFVVHLQLTHRHLHNNRLTRNTTDVVDRYPCLVEFVPDSYFLHPLNPAILKHLRIILYWDSPFLENSMDFLTRNFARGNFMHVGDARGECMWEMRAA